MYPPMVPALWTFGKVCPPQHATAVHYLEFLAFCCATRSQQVRFLLWFLAEFLRVGVVFVTPTLASFAPGVPCTMQNTYPPPFAEAPPCPSTATWCDCRFSDHSFFFVVRNLAECDCVPIVEGNRGCVMFGMSPPAHNNILLGIANLCCLF